MWRIVPGSRAMRKLGCPEVNFGATTASGEFQSEVVVYGLAEFLLAAKIAFSCLNGCMPQQKLNLLKFSAR